MSHSSNFRVVEPFGPIGFGEGHMIDIKAVSGLLIVRRPTGILPTRKFSIAVVYSVYILEAHN